MLLYCSKPQHIGHGKPKSKPLELTNASITLEKRKKEEIIARAKPVAKENINETASALPTKGSPTTTAKATETTTKPNKAALPKTCDCKQHRRHHSEGCSQPRTQQYRKSSLKSSNFTKDKSKDKRRVRFRTVQLQEYSITVGDHPYCKGYFPLTLDWSHAQPIQMKLKEYEAVRRQEKSEHEHLQYYYQDNDAYVYDYSSIYQRNDWSSRHSTKTIKMAMHLNARQRFERLRLVSGMTETTIAYLEQCRQQQQQQLKK